MMYDISKLQKLRIKYPILSKYYNITNLLTNIILSDDEKFKDLCLFELEEILKQEK